MPEDNVKIVTLKIRESDREWVKDEQNRIRKVEGKEPSHAEVFDRLRRAYVLSIQTKTQDQSTGAIPAKETQDPSTIPIPIPVGLDDNSISRLRECGTKLSRIYGTREQKVINLTEMSLDAWADHAETLEERRHDPKAGKAPTSRVHSEGRVGKPVEIEKGRKRG